MIGIATLDGARAVGFDVGDLEGELEKSFLKFMSGNYVKKILDFPLLYEDDIPDYIKAYPVLAHTLIR